MMMKTAGAPLAISPMDYAGRKRPLPRWVWYAVAASAALHVGAGFWLYSQRFEMMTLAPTAPESEPIIIVMPKPKPPEPQPQPDVRPPAPSNATEQPAGPISLTTTVDTAPDVVAVSPETTPPRDPVIRNPDWIRQPTGEQLMRAYPSRAQDLGVTGSATLSCGVRADGTISACSVIDETPGGYGFGRAAQGLSRHFRISPRMVDNQAIEGARVSVTLRFNLPAER